MVQCRLCPTCGKRSQTLSASVPLWAPFQRTLRPLATTPTHSAILHEMELAQALSTQHKLHFPLMRGLQNALHHQRPDVLALQLARIPTSLLAASWLKWRRKTIVRIFAESCWGNCACATWRIDDLSMYCIPEKLIVFPKLLCHGVLPLRGCGDSIFDCTVCSPPSVPKHCIRTNLIVSPKFLAMGIYLHVTKGMSTTGTAPQL